MAYQVLARKCRPQDFSGLIGQETIVQALRNALTEERIAQAYLFSGIRGVGKTSAARVLAKALNCERGPSADPCNECRPCREITAGSDLDVLEVDAATYSKVEQVRELTESLRYGPARDRYKVVILDEVHRLSRQAFDALLKIIEEPPEHLVFIFATTEIEAVPATILSRCQEFNFRRVPSAVLAEHLARITAQEDIEASDAALRLIARAGEGSVRDSVALLDQLATFGAGTISDDDAVRLLGGLDLAMFYDLLAAMLDGDALQVSSRVREVELEGRDPRHVHAQFLGYCRDALHLALGGDGEQIELPEEDAERLAELCRGVAYENLLRLTHQLLSSEASVRRSEAGILALEIAWLRAAELPKLTRVEEILGGAPRSGGAPSGGSASGGTTSGSGSSGGNPSRGSSSGSSGGGTRRASSSGSPARSSSSTPSSDANGNGRSDALPKSAAATSTAAEGLAGQDPAPKAETELQEEPKSSPRQEEPAPKETTPHDPAFKESAPKDSAKAAPAPRDAAPEPDDGDPGPEPPPELVDSAPRSASGNTPRKPKPSSKSSAKGSDDGAAIGRFLQAVTTKKQPLGVRLQGAQDLHVEDRTLVITVSRDDTSWTRTLERDTNLDVLESALHNEWGAGMTWRLHAVDVPAAATVEEAREAAPDPTVQEDPRVQTVLDIFGGKVDSVAPHEDA